VAAASTVDEDLAARRMLDEGSLPPIAAQNASATGTDIVSYLAEGFGVNVFAREGNTVYHCYSSSARGVEFLCQFLTKAG
jgi:hypothetical protein